MLDKYQNKYHIKSARLEGYDYRNEGLYFVTICTKNKHHYFGKIENGNPFLNDIGLIAEKYWADIRQHFNHVSLDAFVLMPNHIHGIVCIDEMPNVETLDATSQKTTEQALPEINKTLHARSLNNSNKNQHFQNISPKAYSLSVIIRSFKSAVSKECRKINPDFEWQPRFHDHIIRDARSFENIRNYIINNPVNWKEDNYYV